MSHKKHNKVTPNKPPKLQNTATNENSIDLKYKRISVYISIAALLVSIASIFFSYHAITNVNSSGHQMANNMTSQVWELQNILGLIDEKINAEDTIRKLDIDEEIKALSQLRMKPEFDLIRLMIKNDDKLMFKTNLRVLAFDADRLSKEDLKTLVKNTIRIISDQQFLKEVQGYTPTKNILNKVMDMKKMEDSVTFFPLYPQGEIHFYRHHFEYKIFNLFVYKMVTEKHVEDPDLLLLNGVIINNPEYIHRALDEGANVNITMKEIKERYHDEYKELLKKF